MDDKLLAGLIAGSISLVVAGLSHLGNKRQLQAQREKLEREIDVRHAEKLYELRLKHYPRAVQITGRLGLPKTTSGAERQRTYSTVRAELKEWRTGEPMLVLSKHALVRIRELEQALKKNPSSLKHLEYSTEQVTKIFRLSLRLRGALRYDLGLLFGDKEDEKNFRRTQL